MANRVLVIGDTHNRKLSVSDSGEVWRESYTNRYGRKMKRKKLNQSITTTGYYRVSGKSEKDRLVHRLIARAFLDDWDEGLEVDHINGDKLDNRVENLRMVSKSGQARGYQALRGGSSAYRGVSFNSEKKKWEAYVTAKGKRIKCGYFKDEINAAKARDKAALAIGHSNESLNFKI